MAKEESTTTKAAPAKATPAKADDTAAAPKDTAAKAEPAKAAPVEETKPDRGERVSTCVVNGGRGFHVGNAVNGAVCSYHAMHYDNAGNRR